MQYVESFNHKLKILTRDLAKRYPTDAKIARAQKRIMTVVAFDPILVIKNVGPYLYKYREQIYGLHEGGEAFFMENTFDTELKTSVDQNKADMVAYIIPKAKESASSLPPDEKEQFKSMIIELLDDYIEYLSAVSQPR